MKVNVMSDLHLEFGNLEISGKSDVLVLAGDVGLAKRPSTYKYFIEDALNYNTEYVIMVMGNHEHYNYDINESYDRIKEETININGFTLLENEDTVIDDVAFIGATFWSDLETDIVAAKMAQYQMNDYQIIRNNTRPITPTDTTALFKKSAMYIFDRIDHHNLQGNKTFVITHHNPTLRTAKEYRGNSLNAAYGTDLEAELEAFKPNFWVYGHTHKSAQFVVGSTQLYCNPRGYAGYEVNEEFDESLILEV